MGENRKEEGASIAAKSSCSCFKTGVLKNDNNEINP